jgi:phenolic acid decarboxylase
MKSKSQIIAEQESIGNVEITRKQFDDFCFQNELRVRNNEGSIYFAPREVVHPEEKIGCGKEDIIKLIDNKINLIREEYPECGNAIRMFEDIKEKLK